MWLEPNTKFTHMDSVHILGLLFFLLLWMNILHSLKILAFSLMHLPMPSYLLNINIVEHPASWIFLFSPDKPTNYVIFPQLKKKKKKSYIDPTHSTGFIPSISAPLCRKTLQSIFYHPKLKSILIAHLFWLLASFSTVSFTCFLSLALTCSWFLLTFFSPVPPLLLLLVLPYLTNF